jgi:ABC-type branched-subunit amino acid transport system ATPase component
VTRLRKAYGDVVAFNEVSFEVADGTVPGVLGPTDQGRARRCRSSRPHCAPSEASSKTHEKPVDNAKIGW